GADDQRLDPLGIVELERGVRRLDERLRQVVELAQRAPLFDRLLRSSQGLCRPPLGTAHRGLDEQVGRQALPIARAGEVGVTHYAPRLVELNKVEKEARRGDEHKAVRKVQVLRSVEKMTTQGFTLSPFLDKDK